MTLSGKKIVLGVSGSIAAYKAVVLLRELQQAGAEVKVVLTAAAARFVAPLTFETLSRYPVFQDLWADGTSWVEHVHLAEWADAFVVAPATANTLAKLAHGLCDDALSAVALSARCPVLVAPAMDLEMYRHLQTRRNLEALKAAGVTVVSPGSGYLASGLEGEGRLAEPAEIVEALRARLTTPLLRGKRVLISAGPTQEPIDPVRYIGNRSTGKMGIALAEAAARLGADTTLVLGPTHLAPRPGCGKLTVVRIETAEDMFREMTQRQAHADCIVMSAAVADFRPREALSHKIKKEAKASGLALDLVKTPDTLRHLGEHKPEGQLLVGFALETNDEEDNAKRKLYEKHLDLIVLNSLNDPQAGFGYDTNRVTLLHRSGAVERFALKPKTEVADDILAAAARYLRPGVSV